MTSATEKLRRLLDERGVEHVDYGGRGHEDEAGRPATWWSGEHGECAAVQRDDDRLLTVEVFLTPEQAIDATLGRGTCHIGRGTSGLMHVTTGHCSECGAEVVKPARYCSNCGRVVE